MNRTLGGIEGLLAGLLLAVLLAPAARAQLDLSQGPLFVGLNVEPNIMMAVDDSGSMDFEVLLPANDGAAWWNTTYQTFKGFDQNDAYVPGVLNFNAAGSANGTWKKYAYLFPNGTGQSVGRRGYGDGTNDHFAVPPFDEYGYLRSPAYNASYFDPSRTYTPWENLGGWTFADSDPAAACSDPTHCGATFDLTSNREVSTSNRVFRMFPGMTIPKGVRYLDWSDGTWKTATVDRPLTNADMPDPCGYSGCTYTGAGRGVAIGYFPATFYLPTSVPLPAGYGYSAVPAAVGLAPDGGALNRYEIKPENFSSAAAYNVAIRNFANWFTYYRKRHEATRGGIGAAFEGIRNFRVGAFTINNRVSPVPVRDLNVSADRDAFFKSVYENFLGTGGTPNREAVDHMGSELTRTGSGAPITQACQRNFGVLFTDGFATLSTPRSVGNVDGTWSSPFADTYSNTMADLAAYYYTTNLRPDLPAGQVPVPATCNASSPDPRLDCESNPHMNLFAVTLGTQGTIFGVDAAATADAYANPPVWPNANATRNPTQIDDLWHGTLDSRGAMLNVAVPSDLGAEFSALLGGIAQRVTSSSAIAANSTRLDTKTLVYQARFRTDDWTGQLLAYGLKSDGSLDALQWDAADLMPAAGARKIFTRDGAVPGAGGGIAFLWSDLSGAEQAALDTAPSGTTDGLGAQRLAWLRGDRTQEQQSGGAFRNRSAVLGDIVNSDPQFVGGQNFGYSALPAGTPGQDSYDAFRLSKLDSAGNAVAPMLYVGANDGMLHGFDGSTGVERFAYVPSTLIGELNQLSDPNYTHRYYVDGQIFVGDAYIDRNGTDRWASVLVGTTGAGGRTVFALDVTDPDNFGAGDVMWEFTDPDLGDVLGQPIVARMQDGTWVAIFGNGYNSDNQRAVLFIVKLADGTLLRKIDTGAGSASSPNGLATPALVADGTRTISTIYAGDLQGNLWKFDVSATSASSWGSAYTSSGTPVPLFQARDGDGNPQPITAPLEIGLHPDGGYMIYFGTGKYFENGDNIVGSAAQIQSFYGIWDRTTSPVGPITDPRATALTEQQILAETTPPGGAYEVRVTTDTAVDWSSKRGWFIDLLSPVNGREGERVVAAPVLRAGRIIFPTLIPSPNPCSFGGGSWLMELDAVNGQRLQIPPLDINQDGQLNDGDTVEIGTGDTAVAVSPSGVKSNEGIIRTPAVISAGEMEYKLESGTSGNVEVLRERGLFDRARGSWRQLR